MTRREICDRLAVAGCTCVGFEWNSDELVERVFDAWLAEGAQRYAVLIVAREPGPAGGQEVVLVEAPKLFDLE